MIHAFFDLPNYTVEWDNSWKNVMFNDYDTYINKNYSTTDAFQKTLENIMKIIYLQQFELKKL